MHIIRIYCFIVESIVIWITQLTNQLLRTRWLHLNYNITNMVSHCAISPGPFTYTDLFLSNIICCISSWYLSCLSTGWRQRLLTETETQTTDTIYLSIHVLVRLSTKQEFQEINALDTSRFLLDAVSSQTKKFQGQRKCNPQPSLANIHAYNYNATPYHNVATNHTINSRQLTN